MGEIDHEYTDEIVCPHCGYVHSDSWEWADGEEGVFAGYECHSCDAPFSFSRHVTIAYSTEKASQ